VTAIREARTTRSLGVAGIVVIALLSALSAPVAAQPSVVGQWSSVPALPFFPVHVALLPTGNVIVWPGDQGISGNDPRLWDPATATTTPLTRPGYDTFCSGHTFLSDGRLFVAGGHIQNNVGLPNASAYDPISNTWAAFPPMNAGRWYPNTTTLPNGDILVVSGSIDNTIGVNRLPQVFQVGTGAWRDLTNAQLGLPLYPQMLLAPNGQIFNSGPNQTTRYLNTSGAGTWTVVGNRQFGDRGYGSAVMYDDGKVLVMGGGDPPTKTAEVIDLNVPTPTWRFVGQMEIARRQINAVLLPDGKVLVTGGTSGPGFNNANTPVFAAEMWDPVAETWTTMASAQIPRLYHSAALLLPDGRVLTTGGNGYPETEVYSPPYLFKGARPTISSAPTDVTYGQSFFVGTSDAAAVTSVTLIRLGSVTHAFNQNQRISRLSFTRTTGGLNVEAPANPNLAPNGHYMLFIVNGTGVPSVAEIVHLGPDAGPIGPTAAYPFEEGAGTTTADVSGNGHPATLVGATWTTAGRYGKAVALNGSSQYLRIDAPSAPTTDFSWMVWARPTSLAGWRGVLEIQTQASTGIEVALDGGRPQLWSNGALRMTAGSALPANAWSHLALTRVGSTLTMYVNGISVGTATETASFDWGNCPFLIGVDADSGCTGLLNGHFAGQLDEVRIYNRALSSTEIQAAMNTPLVSTTPTISISDATVTEGNTGSVNAVFTISLSGTSSQTVTVQHATANGTATAGGDYTATSGTLSFTPGQLTQTVSVPVLGDTIVEPTETFVVNLSNPTNATIGDGQGVGTILDNDAPPPPTLSIGDTTVTEGNAGSVNAIFTVTLSAASTQTVTVQYATANGTATAGSDYTTTAGTLTFTPGQLTQTVSVPVLGDTLFEPTETFVVNLSNPTNATIADGQGVGTITNDDPSPPPTVSISDVTIPEGNAGSVNAVFTVGLSAVSTQTVTVQYATVNGTALAGSDYTITSGMLTFTPGQLTQTVSVPVLGDTIAEPTETFVVNLSNPTNATIGDGQGIGTITDNDGLPGLVIAYGFEEGAGTSTADVSGNGHPGTLVGATWTTAGRYGKAVALNGTSHYVRIDAPNAPTGDFSWMVWARPTSLTGWRGLLEIQTSASTGIELALDAGRPQVWSNGALHLTASNSLPTNTWSHMTITRTGNTLTVYVNGISVGTTTETATFNWSSCPFLIGVDADSGCTGALNGHFAGQLDELRLYNRALSASEIQNAMNTPLPTP
jgi:hypothetical protein